MYEKVLMRGKTKTSPYENVAQPVVVSPREDSVSAAFSSARASSSAGFPNASAAAEVFRAEGSEGSNDAHPVSGSEGSF